MCVWVRVCVNALTRSEIRDAGRREAGVRGINIFVARQWELELPRFSLAFRLTRKIKISDSTIRDLKLDVQSVRSAFPCDDGSVSRHGKPKLHFS